MSQRVQQIPRTIQANQPHHPFHDNQATKKNVVNISRTKQLLYVMQEIKNIQENPNLNQTVEFIIDESNMEKFNLVVRPKDGLYEGLIINFELGVPIDYPAPGSPIFAKCLDNIYHPNIFVGGRLCLTYDGIGNLDTGFKETLENLVIAINYLFLHPANTGIDGKIMPKHDKETIQKNVTAYKLRTKVDKIPKRSSDRLYKIKEVYDSKINRSLTRIKDWESYIPKSCLKDAVRSRYYMFTLGGRKQMDIAKLEDVISNVIRDPRYRFDTAPNIAFVNDEKTQQEIMVPATSFSVVLTKFKRIIYPNDIEWDPVDECFSSNVTFDRFFLNCIRGMHRQSREMIIMCNITIRSNYKFKFTHQKTNERNYPIISSKLNESAKNKKEYIMEIDQYICNMMALDNHLVIDLNESESDDASSNKKNKENLETYIDPSNLVWFYISFSTMIVGEDLTGMFLNVAYRLNPADRTSPYVTTGMSGTRILTDDEVKMISNTEDDESIKPTKMEDYYDIELASKYLASTVEQTGLDLSITTRYLH